MTACSVRTERIQAGATGKEIERWVLEDSEAQSRAELLPSRGALLSRWQVKNRPVLYLDESTLWDPAKSVRGGIPVLFPCAGKLPEDRYEVDGRRYTLRQHGFARNVPWKEVSASGGAAAEVVLALTSSPETLALFPFDFEARLGFRLQGHMLRVDFTVTNRSATRMPLHYGLHPYFAVEDAMKSSANVEAAASRAHDNRTGTRAAFSPPDFTLPELDYHLLDQTLRAPILHRPPLPSIAFEWPEAFPVMVLWEIRGKDYICVEPWTAPAGALHTGEGLRWLSPDETTTLPFAMQVLNA